jgi:hypothetical protein
MNRAESPYDRIVDIPTRASEKDMNKGERVVLCLSVMCIANEMEDGVMRVEENGGRRKVGRKMSEVWEGVTHVHSFQFSTSSHI